MTVRVGAGTGWRGSWVQVEYAARKHPELGHEAAQYAQRMLATDGAAAAAGEEEDPLLSDPAAPRGQPSMKEMPLMAGLRVIGEIYADKYHGDQECDRMGLPRVPLPDVARGYFLRQAGARSVARQRLKDFLQIVVRWAERFARCRIFAHLVGAAGDDDWDAAAAGFVLDTVAAAVPPTLLAERLSAPSPCVGGADAVAATEAALGSSRHAWPAPAGPLLSEVARLVAASHPQAQGSTSAGKSAGDDACGLVLLDDWMDVLLRDWRTKWRVSKEQTMRLVEERQREHSGRSTDRAFTLSRFTAMVRDMQPAISDVQVRNSVKVLPIPSLESWSRVLNLILCGNAMQILHMYRETTDLSASRSLGDSVQPLAFFDVCRRRNINYLGPR